MARGNPQPWTAFWWGDWLRDPGVRLLGNERRGRYIDFLALTNQTDRPGVHPEVDVRDMLGYSAGEWPEHRDTFARCFKIRSDGTWVQERTVEEHQVSLREREKASRKGRKGASVTNAKRWGSSPERSTGDRPAVARLSPDCRESESDTETEDTESESTPSSITSAAPRLNGSALANATPSRRWRDVFERFWTDYPHFERRSSKAKSRALWLKLKPQDEPNLAAIREHLLACSESHDWTRDGGAYVPAAEVWLAKKGWIA